MNMKELYGDKYKVVDDGTDDSDRAERVTCMEIRGKYGAIYPQNANTLAVRFDSTIIAKKAEATIPGLKLHRNGDFEKVYLFAPAQFSQVADIMQARKRKVLTPEARAILVERMRGLRNRVLIGDSKPV